MQQRRTRLMKLAEFSPLRRWSPLGDPAEPPAPSSEAGIEAMKALAREAGDRTYERLLILYEKFPWPFLGKLLAKQLTDPGRTGIYELLEKKIQSVSEKYSPEITENSAIQKCSVRGSRQMKR